jgi:hypothetical protein
MKWIEFQFLNLEVISSDSGWELPVVTDIFCGTLRSYRQYLKIGIPFPLPADAHFVNVLTSSSSTLLCASHKLFS